MDDIRLVYMRNRAEEFGRDVWEDFVVPLYFNKPEVRPDRKSMVIVGGRGCGKTTLLRYYSHSTKFSSRRTILDNAEMAYIGLYLRCDTNFLSTLKGSELSDEKWARAFRHSLACDLGLELVSSLQSINSGESRVKQFGGLEKLDFSGLRDFHPDIGTSLKDLENCLISGRNKLVAWVNNLDPATPPHFLAGEFFLKQLALTVRTQLPYLADSVFSVFIDEYENLHDYQQRIINGLIKHSEAPLVFNVAMKRNGMRTRETEGNETIEKEADYREIDLEEMQRADFVQFAAELLFFRQAEHHKDVPIEFPIDVEMLRDVNKVSERLDPAYQKRVVARAEQLLPRLTEAELAQTAFRNGRIKNRLLENIEAGLKSWRSNISPESYISELVPDASLVAGALLVRQKETPDTILSELRKYETGRESRFLASEWVKNNIVGVVLQLYGSGQTMCPAYAGFENFVIMSRGNIRSFLALVHQVFSRLSIDAVEEMVQVPIEKQALAVRAASSQAIAGIRGRGKVANQLHAMVLTLGAVFRLKQLQPSQSEPEINHFYIQRGIPEAELAEYLSEAIKWSVLFEEPQTKNKALGTRSNEYVLNPIFAGYFQIAFRKKRSIGLSVDELKIMFVGSVEEKDVVIRRLVGDEEPSVNLEFNWDDQ